MFLNVGEIIIKGHFKNGQPTLCNLLLVDYNVLDDVTTVMSKIS